MKREIILLKICMVALFATLFFFLFGCSAQNVNPNTPVYNITITQTDNSQTITGDSNKTKACPITETKSTADIKPEIRPNVEQTTKNGMWIYWLVITAVILIIGWLAWKKWGYLVRKI